MKKILFFLAFILASTSLQAKEISLKSDVNKVTVFKHRAKVTRKAKINITKGKHTLVFSNLPINLDKNSLKLDGFGSDKVIIGSVESKRIAHKELVKEQEKNLKEKLEKLKDEQKLITSAIKSLEKRQSFIDNIGKTAPENINKEIKNNEINPNIWKNAWETIEKGSFETFEKKIKKQSLLRKTKKEINLVRRQLRDIQTGRKDAMEVKVNVLAEKNADMSFELSYMIGGANWYPVYDARLDTKAQNLNIIQYGQVKQRTGEDWKNVELTLSTAEPLKGTQMPDINSWWIDIYEPRIHKTKRMFGGMASTDSISQNMVMEKSRVPRIQEDAFMRRAPRAKTLSAKINAGEYSAEYKIAGNSTVLSNNTDYKFNINKHNMDTKLVSRTTPKYDLHAYLYAFGKYKNKAPLMPGKIALFRDDAFIGTSYMKKLRQNETLKLSFGTDEKIIVKREPISDEKSEHGMIAKQKEIYHKFRTVIENLHNSPAKIHVFENIPVAKNKDIEVKIIKDETSPNYKENVENRQGVLLWKLDFKPKEKKNIDLSYKVTYPKDKKLKGM